VREISTVPPTMNVVPSVDAHAATWRKQCPASLFVLALGAPSEQHRTMQHVTRQD
jgi:hypothetical protein